MTKLIRCALPILLSVISVSSSLPYADDYPHERYATARDINGELEKNSDLARSLKTEQLDVGNDLKSAQDVSKFYNKENASKVHDVNNEKRGSTVDVQRHTVGENLETDKSHNRKQIKSGFQNSYHKDEGGSNSSFYEDSDDRGGRVVYNKKHKHGDDSYDSKYNDRYRDGVVRDRLDDRYGGYDKRGRQDREHLISENLGDRLVNRDGYTRGTGERYALFNDREQYPRRDRYEGVERYGANRRYDPLERSYDYDRRLDRNADRPYVERDRTLESPIRSPISETSYRSTVGGFNNNNLYSSRLPPLSSPPLVSSLNKQNDGYFSRPRITIYEDPRELIDPRDDRDDRRGGGYTSNIRHESTVSGGATNYNSPPIQLDIRPSPLRYRPFDEDERLRERDNLRYRDYK